MQITLKHESAPKAAPRKVRRARPAPKDRAPQAPKERAPETQKEKASAVSVKSLAKSVPQKRREESTSTKIVAVLLIAVLIGGWLSRGRYITAESGAGYYIGIAGAVAMLLLITYPLRKHVRLFRALGPVSFWFRFHMALGLIGPTLILFHANFGLGSANSSVALWSMLIVAGSGLAGRFIYSKIHRGLYGKRAEARVLLEEAFVFRKALEVKVGPKLLARIEALEKSISKSPTSLREATKRAITTASSARKLRGRVKRGLKKRLQSANEAGRIAEVKALRDQLEFSRRYFQRIEQAAELSFYERLFAGWHILHLPLFILLIITALIHVVAVHLY